ncbi:hypothetical protein [Urbifossiella limnaea]|uniref:Uncharacterized protein n=1 Tax=Urbifossiella limnaea TaxID=2528023 RepID=A0A517XNA4_9BACT|nr:hypothetical protein [Urbifossiella limnaea]QDU18991.1 hypothetical protein ETAA1_08920 [Urbifossiella limnaea]
MAAGLRSWGGLLDEIALRAGMTVDERDGLKELRNVLDQATVVERRLTERGDSIGRAVAGGRTGVSPKARVGTH